LPTGGDVLQENRRQLLTGEWRRGDTSFFFTGEREKKRHLVVHRSTRDKTKKEEISPFSCEVVFSCSPVNLPLLP
jgi:hypothetical protein